MSSPQHCMALADEAERLAGIVSYERDKHRLHTQAVAWRQMAAALEAPSPGATLVAAQTSETESRRTSGMAGWLKRRRA